MQTIFAELVNFPNFTKNLTINQLNMGRGDKKTKKGKRVLGSYGNKRRKARTPLYVAPVKKKAPVKAEPVKEVVVEKEVVEEAPKAETKKAAPKKAAAKKTTTKKAVKADKEKEE